MLLAMSVQDLIVAANGAVPKGKFKPRNCHEAVFGWLLQAKFPDLRQPGEGMVEQAWSVLRSLSEAHAENRTQPQLTGSWVGKHLYYGSSATRILPGTVSTLNEGDVVFMGIRKAPHHSMVVVQRQGNRRDARGFNNAGAFGGPFMGWDQQLRDLADPARWIGDLFKANNGGCELWRLGYDAIIRNIPTSLAF